MSINAGSAAAQSLPGLTLKAWASFDTAGTLIKGFNVATVVKNSTGNYTITFTNAMATATYFPIGRMFLNNAVADALKVLTRTTAAVTVITSTAGSPQDYNSFIEIYE